MHFRPKKKWVAEKKNCQWVHFSRQVFFPSLFLFVDRENAQYKNDLFYIMNKEVTMHIHSHKKLKIIKNKFFSNKNHVLCFFLSLNAILDYYFIQKKGRTTFWGRLLLFWSTLNLFYSSIFDILGECYFRLLLFKFCSIKIQKCFRVHTFFKVALNISVENLLNLPRFLYSIFHFCLVKALFV